MVRRYEVRNRNLITEVTEGQQTVSLAGRDDLGSGAGMHHRFDIQRRGDTW
jgi:hypothetical protein